MVRCNYAFWLPGNLVGSTLFFEVKIWLHIFPFLFLLSNSSLVPPFALSQIYMTSFSLIVILSLLNINTTCSVCINITCMHMISGMIFWYWITNWCILLEKTMSPILSIPWLPISLWLELGPNIASLIILEGLISQGNFLVLWPSIFLPLYCSIPESRVWGLALHPGFQNSRSWGGLHIGAVRSLLPPFPVLTMEHQRFWGQNEEEIHWMLTVLWKSRDSKTKNYEGRRPNSNESKQKSTGRLGQLIQMKTHSTIFLPSFVCLFVPSFLPALLSLPSL